MDLELKQKFTEINERFNKIKSSVNRETLTRKLTQLEDEMQSPEIWANQKKASELGSQIRDIKDNLEFLDKWQTVLNDTEVAFDLEDEDLLNESSSLLNDMEQALDKYEVKQMLSDEYDEADAILTINAGAGGTDAQDWASMLLLLQLQAADRSPLLLSLIFWLLPFCLL